MSHDTPNTTNDLFVLTPDPRGNYVTWAQGKKQIRAALKMAGWKAVGLFRPRKVNKNEFHIMATDPMGNMHLITAARKPNAIINRSLLTP